MEGRSDPSWKRVEKRHASVFTGTGLAEWLREQGVSTITLVGYMTNNCILATASEAGQFGLAVEVLSDATGAIHLSNEAGTVAAQQLHETLMVLLQSNFAAVATTKQWLAALTRKQPLPKSNLVTSALQGAAALKL